MGILDCCADIRTSLAAALAAFLAVRVSINGDFCWRLEQLNTSRNPGGAGPMTGGAGPITGGALGS